MKMLKSIIVLFILSTGILFINSCKKEISTSTPSNDEVEQLSSIERRNIALSGGLTSEFIPLRSRSTESQNQVNMRDNKPSSSTLDCTTDPDCIDGGIQFIQAFPENPNYRWRIDIVRGGEGGGKGTCPSVPLFDVNDDDWCLSDQNDITILADPITAAGAIADGFPNVISCMPNIVYNFHYHSNNRYIFIGTLSDTGNGGSSPGAFVELNLYNTNGITNIQVFDVFAPNQDFNCWKTGNCRY